jgi:hypothetical protein
LLGVLALPLFADTRADSDRASCFNNLRQIGRAVEMWADEREGQPPWRTYVARGGTRPDVGTKAGNAWFEFTALSNELVTPLILACPADDGVRVASEFTTVNSRGYMATGLRALATSYLISLDNSRAAPDFLLAGDRNIQMNGIQPCVNGIINADSLDVNFSSGWTNAVHGPNGNILRADGRVEFVGLAGLRTALYWGQDDNANHHFLRAR